MTRLISTTDDIETCRDLRNRVFIQEQGIDEADEWDDLDDDAIHLLARDNGLPTGTARMFVTGETGKIGRVCVTRDQRGTGLGVALMHRAMDILRDRGVITLDLSAQLHVIDFYRKLGFEPHGPIYDDAGIPHRDMTRRL